MDNEKNNFNSDFDIDENIELIQNELNSNESEAPIDENQSELKNDSIGGGKSFNLIEFFYNAFQRFDVQFGLLFAIISFVIVLISSFFSSAEFLTVLWRLILFPILFFFLGFAIIFVIRKFIPDVIEDDSINNYQSNDLGSNIDLVDDDNTGLKDDDDDLSGGSGSNDSSDGNLTGLTKDEISGDSIKIGNINIPNNPEVMAQAIRTVMNKNGD